MNIVTRIIVFFSLVSLSGVVLGMSDWKARSILGISKDATEAEIKKARNDLIKIWHPNKFVKESPKEQAKAQQKSAEINDAYDYLTGQAKAKPKGTESYDEKNEEEWTVKDWCAFIDYQKNEIKNKSIKPGGTPEEWTRFRERIEDIIGRCINTNKVSITAMIKSRLNEVKKFHPDLFTDTWVKDLKTKFPKVFTEDFSNSSTSSGFGSSFFGSSTKTSSSGGSGYKTSGSSTGWGSSSSSKPSYTTQPQSSWSFKNWQDYKGTKQQYLWKNTEWNYYYKFKSQWSKSDWDEYKDHFLPSKWTFKDWQGYRAWGFKNWNINDWNCFKNFQKNWGQSDWKAYKDHEPQLFWTFDEWELYKKCKYLDSDDWTWYREKYQSQWTKKTWQDYKLHVYQSKWTKDDWDAYKAYQSQWEYHEWFNYRNCQYAWTGDDWDAYKVRQDSWYTSDWGAYKKQRARWTNDDWDAYKACNPESLWTDEDKDAFKAHMGSTSTGSAIPDPSKGNGSYKKYVVGAYVTAMAGLVAYKLYSDHQKAQSNVQYASQAA